MSNEEVKYLELALSEIRQIEDSESNFVQMLGTDEESLGEINVEMIANLLEGCKPGQVQQIFGKTKLSYFGIDRIKVLPQIEDLAPQELQPFMQIYFNVDSIVRSALVAKFDTDNKGRKYIMCMLYKRLFDDLGPDEAMEDAQLASTIYLFDDGTFSDEIEEPVNKGINCSRCKHRCPKKVCGFSQSPYYDQTIELTNSCEFFEENLAQDHFVTGFQKALGGETHEAIRELETAIELGLPHDDEMQARFFLGTEYVELVNMELSEREIATTHEF